MKVLQSIASYVCVSFNIVCQGQGRRCKVPDAAAIASWSASIQPDILAYLSLNPSFIKRLAACEFKLYAMCKT